MAVSSLAHRSEDRSGLSENTEHLLIAASSIVTTVMIIFAIYVFYRIRRGSCFSDIFCNSKKGAIAVKQDEFSAQMSSLDASVYPSDGKTSSIVEQAVISKEPTFLKPVPLVARPGVDAPLVTSTNPSLNSRSNPSPRPVTPVYTPRSFLYDSSPPAGRQPAHNREVAHCERYPVVPTQISKPQQVTRYSDGQSASSLSTSIPTFIYGVRETAPKLSRFSWTTTQTTQTPHDTRFSVSPSVASLPRHRTVESWVSQQTGRIEERQIRENLQDRNDPEPVPDVPTQFKHSTVNDASVFQQHPGTEVVIPRGVLIPSAVLNSKMVKSAL